ncbi:HAD family acid phosphatase [Aurantiacibacter odishensis]|uniref:HAD family acid phosphatase n=1 Tax=Aurantiacibacter odishensis TaxID=1155476 RepID=UPI000E72C771|nr:HAD family acid phosphatase [Aurantiacibacter odishensis]
MTKLVKLAASLVCLGLAACAHTGGMTPVAELKPGTAWVLNSDDWASEAREVFAEATQHVDALESARPDGSWYVVLDLDETVMNNVAYQVELDRTGASYQTETWFDWTQQEAATPVPGSIEFVNHVNRAGGHVVFVTNRLDREQLATESNLAKLGLLRGRDFRVLLTRASPEGTSSKEGRFALVPEMLRVQGYPSTVSLAYVGDAKGDRPADWDADAFFCIDNGAMYGDPCASVPLSGR